MCIRDSPYEAGNEREYSLDSRPQEYSTNGVGDYRINSVSVINADGSDAADWRYVGSVSYTHLDVYKRQEQQM